jgi:hypothetical protein
MGHLNQIVTGINFRLRDLTIMITLMRKKMILSICLSICAALLCQLSFAESCPNVSDVKKDALFGWKVYDSEDGTLLSPTRARAFKKNAEQFALAEWAHRKDSKGNIIHCYYRDSAGSALEAYLAKDNFIPKNTKNYWYEVSGAMQCAAGTTECEFQRLRLKHQQLAKK